MNITDYISVVVKDLRDKSLSTKYDIKINLYYKEPELKCPINPKIQSSIKYISRNGIVHMVFNKPMLLTNDSLQLVYDSLNITVIKA